MKNIFAIMFAIFLIGAGCTPSTPEQSAPSTPEQKDISIAQWEPYSNTNTDHVIEFEYPKGYEVQAVETDSFTAYDIREINSSTAKIRIIMTRDNEAAQVFSANAKGGERDGLFERYIDVGQNSFYNPAGRVHMAGYTSLDSQGIFTLVLDEKPSNDLTLAKHVYETLSLVNKK